MSVEFEVNPDTQALTILVSGHFNFSLVSEFRNIYASIESVSSITINLDKTDAIDSSGLSILLYLQKHYDCSRENIHLVKCNPAIIKTLNMAQFRKLFSF
jgi:anti-anti-sigma factor